MELTSFLDIAVSLLTLTALEIVLGIDNLVFLSIVSNRLPHAKREVTRRVGLSVALIVRILLLLTIVWIINLKHLLFSIMSHAFSGRDIFMLLGGLFLLTKSTTDIHAEITEIEEVHAKVLSKKTITRKKKYIG